MSMHEEVAAAIQREIDAKAGAVVMSPTSIAIAVQDSFISDPIDPRLQYASLEHIKQMARAALAKRFDADDEMPNDVQGGLFSGQLQEHYPTPRKRGQEPVYKRREALSVDEVTWNVKQLRRCGQSLLDHANALLAWSESRGAGQAQEAA